MLYKMMLVTKRTNGRKGTNLFGRAKPQPDMVSMGQLFEDDILGNFRLRAVPTRS